MKLLICLPRLLIAENKLFKIGKLKLKGDIQHSINNKLRFDLTIKLIDENICDQIKNTENLLVERISQDIKNKMNYQYESSSDEEDEVEQEVRQEVRQEVELNKKGK